MRGFFEGLRAGLRSLVREPGYSGLIAITFGLALALVLWTAALVEGVLVGTLPFDEPEELVAIELGTPGEPGRDALPRDYTAWLSGSGPENLEAYREFMATVDLGTGSVTVQPAAEVTAGFFSLLGTAPALGPGFSAEASSGLQRQALLSDTAWKRDHGRSPDVIGRALRIDGEPVTVVGVLPPGISFPRGQEIWLSLANADVSPDRSEPVSVVGRLSARTSPAALQDRLQQTLPPETIRETPEDRVRVTRFTLAKTDPTLRTALLLMFVGSLAVLGLSTANATNLVMARTLARRGALVVRASMGAQRRDLITLVMVETLVPTLCGGLLGLGLGILGLELFDSLVEPGGLLQGSWISLDLGPRALGVLLLATVGAGLLASLGPALLSTRRLSSDVLPRGTSVVGGTRTGWFRRTLVVVEVALAAVLVIGTVLVLQSVLSLLRLDLGIEDRGVLTAKLSTASAPLPAELEGRAFFDRLAARLEEAPDVERVGWMTSVPAEGSFFQDIELADGPRGRTRWIVASAEALSSLGVPLLSGQSFPPREDSAGEPTVLVNQSFVERYPGTDIGDRLRFSASPEARWHRIVGIVGDYVVGPVEDDDFRAIVFTPMTDARGGSWALVAKTEGVPSAELERRLRRAAGELSPGVLVFDVEPLGEIFAARRWTYDSLASLFALFGGVSLVLVMTGTFGVLSEVVGRRIREMGLRLALGATPSSLLRLIVSESVLQIGAGLLLGVLGALGATRLLAPVLHGVEPWDPISFVLGIALVGGCAVAAAYRPALAASRTSPAISLRSE